ncbi:hypothetical protein GCM10011371_34830 [Novosphingobium marinum]|uniref:ADP-ribosyl-[dinitrogen reductase] hydrolase n=1 Tax=Novosphingobium marinum TaxID=1514948 RepID=A0A7Y9XYV9_9SPHN|nr:ADP-ribosylglycohydrolase family protein [Novosphingobium marinum]NYH97184.1 ADP-ribosyl-[dinitrogen reductase] hydrolase [Novosphingobium marinum]GGC44434.1 hypothetical protein GCM10011371_34830 [Novosphingobium marinum]
MRTSTTHPLQIASVRAGDGMGRVGLTFCPGKFQPSAMTGGWERDLALDMTAIAQWGAGTVVTLLDPCEMTTLAVGGLGEAVKRHGMTWLHLPIRDVSVPDRRFEEAWQVSGEALRTSLRAGFDVLVHCKGGLGRAGMIAARLLAELGMAPRTAIEAVREARPGAIETSHQEDHVLGTGPVAEPVPDASPRAAEDRAVAALLGLAAGDALGASYEFRRRGSYVPTGAMTGGGPFGLAPGQWTDDTAMALALAESLLDHPALDATDLMERFASWRTHGTYSCTGTCFDIGMTTAQAIARYRRDGDPLAGSTDPHSAGNGSLMRLAPVAIRHWRDRAAMHEVAALQSRTTHGAAEAVDACIGFCDMLADAIAGRPRSEVLRPRQARLAPAISRIMAGSWQGRHRDTIASTGYVVHSLEAAIWCTARTGSAREALVLASGLGEDTDTVAAITGQLAGALHGTAALPAQWLDALAWRERIEETARRLFRAGA